MNSSACRSFIYLCVLLGYLSKYCKEHSHKHTHRLISQPFLNDLIIVHLGILCIWTEYGGFGIPTPLQPPERTCQNKYLDFVCGEGYNGVCRYPVHHHPFSALTLVIIIIRFPLFRARKMFYLTNSLV